MNVPPHSLSVSRKCWSELQGPFQHANKTNSKLVGMVKNYVPYLNYHHTTSSRVALIVYSVRGFVVGFHEGQIKISACLREHQHPVVGCFDIFVRVNDGKQNNSDHTQINRTVAWQRPPPKALSLCLFSLSSCLYRTFQIHSVHVQSYDTEVSLTDSVRVDNSS